MPLKSWLSTSYPVRLAHQLLGAFMAELPPGFDLKALEVTAAFVNHIQVSRLGTMLVRLSFAESPVPNTPTYRSAVMMTTEDAMSLMSLLQKALGLNIVPPPEGSRPN